MYPINSSFIMYYLYLDSNHLSRSFIDAISLLTMFLSLVFAEVCLIYNILNFDYTFMGIYKPEGGLKFVYVRAYEVDIGN